MNIQEFLNIDPNKLNVQSQKIKARFQMLAHVAEQAQREAELSKLKAIRAIGALEEFEKFVIEFVADCNVTETKEN